MPDAAEGMEMEMLAEYHARERVATLTCPPPRPLVLVSCAMRWCRSNDSRRAPFAPFSGPVVMNKMSRNAPVLLSSLIMQSNQIDNFGFTFGDSGSTAPRESRLGGGAVPVPVPKGPTGSKGGIGVPIVQHRNASNTGEMSHSFQEGIERVPPIISWLGSEGSCFGGTGVQFWFKEVGRSIVRLLDEMPAESWTGLSRTRAYGQTHRDTVAFDDADGLDQIEGLRHVELRKVDVVHTSKYVFGITCEWSAAGGKKGVAVPIRMRMSTHPHSNGEHVTSSLELDLDKGEHITSINLWSGSWVDRIQLSTSHGNTLSVGGGGGRLQGLEIPRGSRLLGFHGGYGGHLHKLGIITFKTPGCWGLAARLSRVRCESLLVHRGAEHRVVNFDRAMEVVLNWLIDSHMDAPWQTQCHDRVEQELRATEQWISTHGTLQALSTGNENSIDCKSLALRKRQKCVVQ